ncbi:hypothetical protein BGZ63DRAFT_19883 [Mariannaea sp. PMI_226]|nr:hypothetical protein BGZ63DRAFT_19883 [Mariannaea sp. PMI_226]
MSRIAAPVSKLTRAIVDSQRVAGASLMPKYDELLRTRRTEDSRHITTTHRPTPQPSIANRPKPLMQGFHTSPASKAAAVPYATVILPPLHSVPDVSEPVPRVPLLPDNYGAYHASISDAVDLSARAGTIVAANPENVLPGAPLAEIEPVTVDGVELKFAHQPPATEDQSTIIRDLLQGMLDDVIGVQKKTA